MTWITVPANNLQIGENTLKLWSPESYSGTITSIRVTASAEAGQLKTAFGNNGGLTGDAKADENVGSYTAATQAALAIITDMEEDSRLSPSEKTTWRQSWIDTDAKYLKVTLYAESLGVDYSSLTTAHDNLADILIDSGVWTDAGTTSLLTGSTLSDYARVYAQEYRALSDACTDKIATNASADATIKAAAAKSAATVIAENFTQNWSEEGADVTRLNQAASIINQGTLALLDQVDNDHIVEIDGSKITAGTIVAGQIATNAIVARHILADQITTAKIASGSITAAEITVGTITADRIISTAGISGNRLNSAGNGTISIPANGEVTVNHNLGRYPVVNFWRAGTSGVHYVTLDHVTTSSFTLVSADNVVLLTGYAYF